MQVARLPAHPPATVRRTASLLLAACLVLTGCSTTATENEPTEPARSASASASMEIPAADGPGVSSAKVRVTVETPGDETKKIVETIVAHFNESGGLGGRAVEIVKYPDLGIDPNAPIAQLSAAECKAFIAADVFALLTVTTLGRHVPFEKTTCAKDNGVVTVMTPRPTSADFGIPDASLDENPFLFAPSDMSYLRMASTLARRVKDDGLLEGVGRTAVLYDPDTSRREADLIVQKLTEGQPDLQVDMVAVSKAAAGFDATILNTIVKLKAAGYDLVLPVPDAAWVLSLTSMARQRYTPRIAGFGLTLDQFSIAGVPADFLEKIVGYDYRPANPTIPESAMRNLLSSMPGAMDCYRILDTAGIAFDGVEAYPLTLCSQLIYLKAALDASGSKQLNAAAIAVGSGRLGTSFRSLECFRTNVGPDRRDGADAVRMIAYDPAAKAFLFSGSDLPAA